MLLDPKGHWERAYADGDAGLSWTEPVPRRSVQAIASLGLDPAAPILDVGGGSSGLAGELIRAGYSDVTVLDLSAAALSLARRRLGGDAARVAWIATDLRSWSPQRRYELWHDRAVLHFFVDPNERQRYAEILRSALLPESYVVITTFPADGPAQCSGLPVLGSSPQQICALLGPEFTLLDSSAEQHVTPRGVPQPFVRVIARRARDEARHPG
ncbi:MAG TPA: class I SAM-dependent methyltransferase [Solirubrobacteraceae bacterium]|nr:class I SAM-dependent methyltransferase [Solirubrobacteraceae bacterium]